MTRWRRPARRIELLTIPGGGHGDFTPEQRSQIYAAVRAFLAKHGLPADNP